MDSCRASAVHPGYSTGRLVGLQKHGKKWKEIQGELGTRTSSQIRTHAQKFFIKLKEGLKCDDAQALAYVRSQPATFFVSETDKYARLLHLPKSDQPGPNVGGEGQVLNPSLSRLHRFAGKRIKLESHDPYPLDAVPAKLQAYVPITTSSTPTGQRENDLKRPQPMVVRPQPFHGPIKGGDQTRDPLSGSPPPQDRPAILDAQPSLLSELVQNSSVLSGALENKLARLSAFCSQLAQDGPRQIAGPALDPTSARHWHFLQSHATQLQEYLKGIMAIHYKSSALVQYLLLQSQMSALQQVLGML